MSQNRTILYVEDDAVTLTAYKRRLEQAGFNVETARDGVEAMKFLHNSNIRNAKPDLILLDLMLPRLNGEEVLRLIHDDCRLNQISIVVLSTNSTLTLANEHLLAETTESHVLKHDCTFDKLLQIIEDSISKTEASKTNRTKNYKSLACPTAGPSILRHVQLNRKQMAMAEQLENGTGL